MKTLRFKTDFGFIAAGRLLKQAVTGDYFLSATDEEWLQGKLPWTSVSLTKAYVETVLPPFVEEVPDAPKFCKFRDLQIGDFFKVTSDGPVFMRCYVTEIRRDNRELPCVQMTQTTTEATSFDCIGYLRFFSSESFDQVEVVTSIS